MAEEIPWVVSRRSMMRAVGSGRREWTRVRRGRYVAADAVAGLSAEHRHLVQMHAQAAAVSPDAVFSHVSAAVAHGLPVDRSVLIQVHVTRDRRSGGRTRQPLALHAASLAADEVVEASGLRVTAPARTVVDLARYLSFADAVAVGDAALRSGLVTRADLVDQQRRSAGRPGMRRANEVIEFLDGRSESPGESRLRVVVRELGFTGVELQAELRDDADTLAARVDLLLPDLGVAMEFDGRVKYQAAMRNGRDPEEVVVAEKLREDRIRRLGWMVVRVTWDDLLDPARLAHRIRSAAVIAARSARIGVWLAPPRI
jgi:hypothetical protein